MAKRRATTSRPARRKTTTRRRAQPRRAREVKLKPVFNQLNASVARLKRAEQTREVKGAIARLTRAMREINAICGPDMIVPLPGA